MKTRLIVIIALFACTVTGIASANVVSNATRAAKAWQAPR